MVFKFLYKDFRLIYIKLIFLYLLTKDFWDSYFGYLPKMLFYSSLGFFSLFEVLSLFCRKSIKENLITFIFFSYSIYIFFNSLLCNNIGMVKTGLYEYILLPFFCIYSMFYITRKIQISLKEFDFFINLGSIIALLALYEFITGNKFISNSESDSWKQAVVFSIRPQTLGMSLAFCLIFGMFRFFTEGKFFFLIKSIIIFIGLYVSMCRGATGGAIVGTIFMFYTLRKKHILHSFVYKSILIVFIFIFLFMIAFSHQITINYTFDRFISALDFKNDTGNVIRLIKWNYYLNAWTKKPFIGYGIATTNTNNILPIFFEIGNTESGFIKRIVETGLLGIGLYYCFFYKLLKSSLFKRNKKLPSELFIALLIVFILENLVFWIFTDSVVMFFIFFFISYAFNQENRYNNGHFNNNC